MTNFSQLLAEKTDAIAERWLEAVYLDRQIQSDDVLSRADVRDHISDILSAMATVLSQSQESDVQTLARASLVHGVLRAEQGFDPKEIAREYRLLRWEIFSALEADLLAESPAQLIRVVRLIDLVVDEAIAQCFKSYTDTRLQELQQLQNQLTLTNQELTRLIRAGQDNLSQLAHEIKTPLNSIIGYSELFLRSLRQHPEEKDSFPKLEHIERVLRNGRQLLHLVNDTLELSRYEAGKMQLRSMPTDVRALIRGVMEVLEPMARAKELPMAVNSEFAPAQVLTDPLRLQQIITNLLSNAIRYTQRGSIQLTCQVLPNDQWSIAVADTGIGISPEDQSRIFDPFFRVGEIQPAVKTLPYPLEDGNILSGRETATYVPRSTGLGLAIVLRLVKLLQGRIDLESQVGVGSTFTITLPLAVKTPEEGLS